jgi:hypothetical protein
MVLPVPAKARHVQVPPPTPAYLGWDPDPVLDGWEVHRLVFEALEPFRVAASLEAVGSGR